MTNLPEKRRPRRWARILARLFLLAIAAICLAGAAVGIGAYLVYDYVTRPGVAGEKVEIVIPEGTTASAAGRILAEQGLIDHEWFFKFAVRLDESSETIKHGSYMLPRGLSPTELLHHLQGGPQGAFASAAAEDTHRITIPEGLSIQQISAMFDNPSAFIEAAADPTLRMRLGMDAPTLEGFLMPNTYFFDKKPTEREVVERMVTQFEKEYQRLLASHPQLWGEKLIEWVTIASLVEEEARVEEERALVSAVIHNRLERKMTLDLDCTLQYALTKYGQRLLNDDKAIDSPYNTYTHGGLPPGPISNPGLASLKAALEPAPVKYAYFVSNADGKTHTFSETLDAHQIAVNRYRKEIAEQRRQLKVEREQSSS